MPIDASILLRAADRPMETPAETGTRLAELERLRLGNQSTALDIRERRVKQEQQEAIQAVLRKAGGNLTAALPEIYRINPEAGLSLHKVLQEHKKGELEQQTKELEIAAKKAARKGQLAGSVKDQSSYIRAVQQMVDEGLISHAKVVAGTPQVFNEQTKSSMSQIQLEGLEIEKQLQAQLNTLKEIREQNQLEETKRHQKATEGKLTGDRAEFLESFYPGWLEKNKLTKTAANEMLAFREYSKLKRERVPVPGTDIPLPADVEAQIRERTAVSQERAEAARQKQQHATRINRMNGEMNRMNRAREEEGLPLLTSPPGSEISQLENTKEGPGVRRWGYGNRMPRWLAEQYFKEAGGDRDEATEMAEADGWILE